MSSVSTRLPCTDNRLPYTPDHGLTPHCGLSRTVLWRFGGSRDGDHDHSGDSASPSPVSRKKTSPEPQTTDVDAPEPPSSPPFTLRPAVFYARPITPLVVPIPLGTGVEQDYVLRVTSDETRGLSVASICITGHDGKPRADLCLIKKLVDWQDLCVCSQVPGPTVRIGDIGREWPGTVLYLPGCPMLKAAHRCFIYSTLVWYVLKHFLEWWTCEVQDCTRAGFGSKLRYAPGAVQLDQVFLVALRRRHIALGVYEWLPEFELRL